MKKLGNLIIGCVLLSLTAVSCKSVAPQQTKQTSPNAEQMAKANARMLRRARQFRQYVTSKSYETGICIKQETFNFYKNDAATLAARCKLLGIKQIYLQVETQKLNKFFSDYPGCVRTLLKEMHRFNIRCFAALECSDLFCNNQSSTGIFFRQKSSPVKDRVNQIKTFNRKAGSPAEAFDGIEVVLLPHEINEKTVRGKKAHLYIWRDNGYGKDRENDIMLARARKFMTSIQKAAHPLPVYENTAHFYHDKTIQGKLGQGRADDYLNYCKTLIVKDFSSDKKDIINNITAELKSASRPRSVAMKLRTSAKLYGEEMKSTSLSWKKWVVFVRELNYVTKKAAEYESFRGMIFDDFAGFEALWERNR